MQLLYIVMINPKTFQVKPLDKGMHCDTFLLQIYIFSDWPIIRIEEYGF